MAPKPEPTFLFTQLLGLAPFSAAFITSPSAALASVAMLAALAYEMSYLPIWLYQIRVFSGTFKQILSANLATRMSAWLGAVLCVILSLFCTRHALKVIFDNLKHVDALLKDDDSLDRKLRRSALVQIVVYVPVIAAILLFELWFSEWKDAVIITILCAPNVLCHVEIGRFVWVVRSVFLRVAAVNVRVEKADGAQLRMLRAVHLQLFLVSQRVNGLFGLRMLFLFGYLLVSATAHAFIVVSYAKFVYQNNLGPNAVVFKQFLHYVAWLAVYVTMTACACFAAQSAVDEAGGGDELVDRRLLDTTIDDKLRAELRRFRAQLRDTQLAVSACAMFDVDAQLLLGAAATVTTYAVIMVTFS